MRWNGHNMHYVYNNKLHFLLKGVRIRNTQYQIPSINHTICNNNNEHWTPEQMVTHVCFLLLSSKWNGEFSSFIQYVLVFISWALKSSFNERRSGPQFTSMTKNECCTLCAERFSTKERSIHYVKRIIIINIKYQRVCCGNCCLWIFHF